MHNFTYCLQTVLLLLEIFKNCNSDIILSIVKIFLKNFENK